MKHVQIIQINACNIEFMGRIKKHLITLCKYILKVPLPVTHIFVIR